MTLFTYDMFEPEDGEAGVTVSQLGRALVTWAAMNDRDCTVADAMSVFNTTRDVIIAAVADSGWAYLSNENCDDPAKTLIELDGE